MDSVTSQIQNSDDPRKDFRKFLLIVCLVTFSVLIFIGWSITKGEGERNLGTWLIFLIIPFAIRNTFLLVGLSLLLKFFSLQFFKNGQNHPVLVVSLTTLLVSLIAGYFLALDLFVSKESNLNFFYIGVVFVGFPAIATSVLSYLFKVIQPDFWRLNLGPAIITFSLVMLVIPSLISGWNSIFTKLLACDFVRGRSPQFDCYRTKAIKTGNTNLCVEKKLDWLMPGDCIIAIAITRKDLSLCELPAIKTNSKNYSFCVSGISNGLDDF